MTATTSPRHPLPALLLLLCFLPVMLHATLADAAETMIPLRVAKGTNLITIAKHYCRNSSDWREIARLNNLSPPYLILEDSTLLIPLSSLTTEQMAATVGAVHGQAVRIDAEGREQPLQKGDRLLPGQTLATGPDGYAHLIFPDYRFTRVESDSVLTLVYLIRLSGDQAFKAELFLEKGRVAQSIKQKLKDNENFDTRTPLALTGVRGTEFRVKMMDAAVNQVETLSGVVRVTAGSRETALKPGEGLQLAKGQSPGPPHLLPTAPDPTGLAPVYRTLPAVFKAPGHKDAQHIRVRLTTDLQGDETVLEQVVAPGQSFNLVSLPDATYQAFLTAIDKSGFESPATGPLALKIRTIPSAPVISAPKNGLILFEKSVDIKWLKGEQAVAFATELATDANFQHIIHTGRVDAPHCTTPNLQPGSYYFRVRAVAADGFTSDSSPPVNWQISAEPVLSGSKAADNLSLRWAAMGETVTYDFQMARDRSFTQPVVSVEKLTKPEYSSDDYLAPGDYYIRIRANLQDGQTGPWTPAQFLTVEPGPLLTGHVVALITLLGFILL